MCAMTWWPARMGRGLSAGTVARSRGGVRASRPSCWPPTWLGARPRTGTCRPSCIASAGWGRWQLPKTMRRLEARPDGVGGSGSRCAGGLIRLFNPAFARTASGAGGGIEFSDDAVIPACVMPLACSPCLVSLLVRFRVPSAAQSGNGCVPGARAESSGWARHCSHEPRDRQTLPRSGRRRAWGRQWLPMSRAPAVAGVTRSCGTGLY